MTTIRGRSATQYAVLAAFVVCAAVYAVEAYQRRWISDDGLIAIRTPRQLLAGHGVSFTPYDREEANTSVLWTWLLTVLAAVTPGDTAVWTVWLGIVLSVAALMVAMDASRRFHRGRGASGILLPGGVMVVLAVSPFWDFATSGLETSLGFLWLAGTWWLLVDVTAQSTPRRLRLTAFAAGLGSLVRPEFGIATIALLTGLTVLARPGRREALRWYATALALPLVYEIFRAGYYGVLLPGPAIAKEAATSDWSRGVGYLQDFVGPYWLWVPLLLLTAAGIALFRRPGTERTRLITLTAVPVATGLVMALYTTNVGGDYMHARMLLPPLYAILLPLFLIPVPGRLIQGCLAVLATWAVISATSAHLGYHGTHYGPAPLYLADERSWEAQAFGTEHPTGSADHYGNQRTEYLVHHALANHLRVLILNQDGLPVQMVPLAADRPESMVLYGANMGVASVLVPADGGVADEMGIVSSLSAHQELTGRIRAGHEKTLSLAWVLAEYGDPATVDGYDWGDKAPESQIRAARHALTCGPLKELLAATGDPMTPGRFWDNLFDAFHRTSLRFPPDPDAAEREYCP